MKFSAGKCQVLCVGRNNLRHQPRLGTSRLENSSAEVDLRVRMDERLNVSQRCTVAAEQANSVLAVLGRPCPAGRGM